MHHPLRNATGACTTRPPSAKYTSQLRPSSRSLCRRLSRRRGAPVADYFLNNLIGFPVDTTIAAARIMFSGLLSELPAARPEVLPGACRGFSALSDWTNAARLRCQPIVSRASQQSTQPTAWATPVMQPRRTWPLARRWPSRTLPCSPAVRRRPRAPGSAGTAGWKSFNVRAGAGSLLKGVRPTNRPANRICLVLTQGHCFRGKASFRAGCFQV
jgi:hypothetical protein